MMLGVVLALQWHACVDGYAFAAKGLSSVRRETALRATRTQRVLEQLDSEGDGQGAGAAGTYEGLVRLDRAWAAIRDSPQNANAGDFVRVMPGRSGNDVSFDVCVLGGTLGIFVAVALQRRGLRCCVVERGTIAGRKQEWNLSLDEVMDLVEAGVFDEADVDGATGTPGFKEVLAGEPGTLVASHFGSVRAGFNDRESDEPQEVWLPRVLNIGVRPDVAVSRARRNFEAAGGIVYEQTSCAGINIYDESVQILFTDNEILCSARLVVDAMGNASPISRQSRAIANGGVPPAPSGVCCVVGTAASGFTSDNSYGDLIYTNENARTDRQYFWEAFPAKSLGDDVRTTYLFTYLSPDDAPHFSVQGEHVRYTPLRLKPTLLTGMFEDYLNMLPIYQRRNAPFFSEADCAQRGDLVDAALASGDLRVLRCLYGLFPTYRDSPLRSRWNRVVAVGDASGTQSPLSFGGFGALTRHVDRLASAIVQAVHAEALDAKLLAWINPYTPNLAATWMFQKSFVVPSRASRPKNFVTRLMRQNYENMRDLGDDVLRPFNQDVVQPLSLLKVLGLATIRDPGNIPQLIFHIGPIELADWLRHFTNMLLYDTLHRSLGDRLRRLAALQSLDSKSAYQLERLADAWEFGSGNDYKLGCEHKR